MISSISGVNPFLSGMNPALGGLSTQRKSASTSGLDSGSLLDPTSSAGSGLGLTGSSAASPMGQQSGSMPTDPTQIVQLIEMLAQMMQMLAQLLGQLGGGQSPAASNGLDSFQNSDPLGTQQMPMMSTQPSQQQGVPGFQPSSGGGGGSSSPVGNPDPSVIPQTQSSSNDSRNQDLQSALSDISRDPEGQKLLAAAKQKGVQIQMGPPEAAQADGSIKRGYQQGNNIVINSYDSKEGLRATLAHELVHAATQGDGNSMQEETVADVVGNRIARRINGQGTSPQQEKSDYSSRSAWVHNPASDYLSDNLPENNGILQSLQGLGIDVSSMMA
jgi:hypothetical protein